MPANKFRNILEDFLSVKWCDNTKPASSKSGSLWGHVCESPVLHSFLRSFIHLFTCSVRHLSLNMLRCWMPKYKDEHLTDFAFKECVATGIETGCWCPDSPASKVEGQGRLLGARSRLQNPAVSPRCSTLCSHCLSAQISQPSFRLTFPASLGICLLFLAWKAPPLVTYKAPSEGLFLSLGSRAQSLERQLERILESRSLVTRYFGVPVWELRPPSLRHLLYVLHQILSSGSKLVITMHHHWGNWENSFSNPFLCSVEESKWSLCFSFFIKTSHFPDTVINAVANWFFSLFSSLKHKLQEDRSYGLFVVVSPASRTVPGNLPSLGGWLDDERMNEMLRRRLGENAWSGSYKLRRILLGRREWESYSK